MRSLITLDEWSAADVLEVFALADAYSEGRGPA
jgi:ornithine carbamoyltransferase